METEFVYNLTLTYFTKNKVANFDSKCCMQLQKGEKRKAKKKDRGEMVTG